MQVVDDVGVAMPPRFPVIAQVRMVGRQSGMVMRDLCRVLRGPEAEREDGAGKSDERHHEEGRTKADPRPEPAGERVAEKPAGMRERELSGEDRGAVGSPGRAAEKPARGVCAALYPAPITSQSGRSAA